MRLFMKSVFCAAGPFPLELLTLEFAIEMTLVIFLWFVSRAVGRSVVLLDCGLVWPSDAVDNSD